MSIVAVHIEAQPSRSKGWARYRVTRPDGEPLISSRTGNSWVSADHEGDAEPGAVLTLEMDVSVRVGAAGTRRGHHTVHVVVDPDSEGVTIEHRPGSQGLRLRIAGVRAAEAGA